MNRRQLGTEETRKGTMGVMGHEKAQEAHERKKTREQPRKDTGGTRRSWTAVITAPYGFACGFCASSRLLASSRSVVSGLVAAVVVR